MDGGDALGGHGNSGHFHPKRQRSFARWGLSGVQWVQCLCCILWGYSGDMGRSWRHFFFGSAMWCQEIIELVRYAIDSTAL